MNRFRIQPARELIVTFWFSKIRTVSWTTVPRDTKESSEDPAIYKARDVVFSASFPVFLSLSCINKSKTDPKRHSRDCRYWALTIGASCSESPATISQPTGDNARMTRDEEPRVIWPASSITRVSTSRRRFLAKLCN